MQRFMDSKRVLDQNGAGWGGGTWGIGVNVGKWLLTNSCRNYQAHGRRISALPITTIIVTYNIEIALEKSKLLIPG